MHLVLTSNMRLLFIGHRSIAAKQLSAEDIILICRVLWTFQGGLQLVIFFSVLSLDGLDLLEGSLAGRFEPLAALVLASLVTV